MAKGIYFLACDRFMVRKSLEIIWLLCSIQRKKFSIKHRCLILSFNKAILTRMFKQPYNLCIIIFSIKHSHLNNK